MFSFYNLRLEISENSFNNLKAKPRNRFPQGFFNWFSTDFLRSNVFSFYNLRLEILENSFNNLKAKPRNIFPQRFSNRFSMISCAAIYYIFLSPVTGGRYLIVYLYVAVVTDNLQCITHPSSLFYFRTRIPRIPRIDIIR